MFLLIDLHDPGLRESTPSTQIKWPVMGPEAELEVIRIKPPVPVEPSIQPELIKHVESFDIEIDEGTKWIEPPIVKITGGDTMQWDKPLTLKIGYPPRYPKRAIANGVNGYAVIGFSVTAAGEVYDPYVIDSAPKGVFEKSAMQAILKFRYQAKTIEGKAVSADGQRYKFVFEMDN